MYLPFDQNNPKVKAIITTLTVALVIIALVVVFKTVGPSITRPNTGVQYSLGYILADAMAKAIGSGEIVTICFDSSDGTTARSPVFDAQKEGINDALKKHSEVRISNEVEINIGQPMMMELISARDIEQIIQNHPKAKGILSMVGLPRGGPAMIPGLRGDDHPIIVAYDASGFEIEAWIGSKRAAAIAVMNFEGIDVPNPPTGPGAKDFNEKFILVTQDNFESLGNVAGPGQFSGAPPGN